MDKYSLIITIVGTVAGLLSLWLSTSGWSQRLIGLFGLLCIASSTYFLTSYTLNLSSRLTKIESVAIQANKLVADSRFYQKPQGFTVAALAFLETNKFEFPDTYKRALDLCDTYRCMMPDEKIADRAQKSELAETMKSILIGISVMKGNPNYNSGNQ